MEYPSDIFQYCAPVIYYFVVEAPSVSNIPSFFSSTMGSVTNGQQRRRKKKKNLFISRVPRQPPWGNNSGAGISSFSPFPIKEQRRKRERKKKQIRADAEGKISDGIHFLCHPLTEETIDLQRSISVQLSVNADDDRFFWRNNTLSHLFILISQAVESLNRSFLQEGKWRQLTQSLKLFTNRIFRLFS